MDIGNAIERAETPMTAKTMLDMFFRMTLILGHGVSGQ